MRRKLALVADYLDIWLTRYSWSYKSTAQRTIRYGMFTLSKTLRGKTVPELSAFLRERLYEDHNTFARHPDLRVHQQNFYGVRHILARLTHWVDSQCGVATHFEDYVNVGKGRPFEVEHLWANHYERYKAWFAHPSEFERGRNRIGGLVLLQRGHNQSLGDLPYDQKRDAYVAHGQSLLTRSLHPLAYKNNPAFTAFIERTGLDFRPQDDMTPEAQQQRQELYLRIAEWVWNPSRLDLDGMKPPVHEPLVEPEDDDDDPVEPGLRQKMRKEFFSRLIAHSKAENQLHGHLSPTQYSWLGARGGGFWWNYNLTQHSTRVELAISNWEQFEDKAIFDRLVADRESIEAEYGGKLDWQRLDDNIVSKVGVTVAGGWADEAAFDATAVKAVEAMKRLHASLVKRAKAAREPSA